jgi:hypothetical protein
MNTSHAKAQRYKQRRKEEWQLFFTFLRLCVSLSVASRSAAYYKVKCVMCHGKKAEKKFNATLTDDQMVEVVLVATVISDSYIFSVLQITLSCDVYNQPDDF